MNHDTVELIGQRVRDLHAGDAAPVGRDHVVVGIALDVVVVARAYRHRQMGGAIEHDDEADAVIGERHRRKHVLAEALVGQRRDVLRRIERAQQQDRRGALKLAQRGGDADMRHRLGALVVDDDADVGLHDLGVLDARRRRILHVAIPFGARRVAPEVPRHRDVRGAEIARLAARLVGLAGLPVPRRAADRDRLEAAQRVGAALRRDRGLDEIDPLLGPRRRKAGDADQQRDHER